MGDNIRKPRYQKAVHKCRNLDPDKRYQSMRQVRLAFFPEQRKGLWAAALVLAAVLGLCAAAQPVLRDGQRAEDLDGGAGFAVLSAPGNPHWDGETGNVVWDNVPESGVGDAVHFRLRLYCVETAANLKECLDKGKMARRMSERLKEIVYGRGRENEENCDN